jgi:hypothetical protein
MRQETQKREEAVCHAKENLKGKRLVWRTEPRVGNENRFGPEPRTPNPEPRTPNPEPRTPNPEPRTPNPEPDGA